MKRGGHSFHHAENVKKTKYGRPGLALPRGPLAQGKHGHSQIIGGFAFVKVQSVHGVPYPGGKGIGGGVRAGAAGFSGVCHGVGFYGVRKPATVGGFGVVVCVG